jgi:hypothetical protein
MGELTTRKCGETDDKSDDEIKRRASFLRGRIFLASVMPIVCRDLVYALCKTSLFVEVLCDDVGPDGR